MDIAVRSARLVDAGRLAELSGQLGYPCAESDVSARMLAYIESAERTILVAEAGGGVLGWLSLDVVDHFYIEPFVEMSGFVVDAEHRGEGIGAAMVAAAEAWVLERGLAMLRLKTNAVRKDAHRFYERMGFENVKEQIVYVKKLGAGRGAGYFDGVERDGGDTMRPSAAR